MEERSGLKKKKKRRKKERRKKIWYRYRLCNVMYVELHHGWMDAHRTDLGKYFEVG